MRYNSKNGSKYLLHAHLVFTVKYRRKVISDEVSKIMFQSFQQSAFSIGVTIVETETESDHVHVLITYPPNVDLAEIVRRLKGASSRAIRAASIGSVKRKLWGSAFWSPSYFVVSCGGAPIEAIKAYIQAQDGPLTTS